MRSVAFNRVSRNLASLSVLVLFAMGCSRYDSEIKTYRVAKEDNTLDVPTHSPDDGHDHSHDGHNHPPGEDRDHAPALATRGPVPKLTWDVPTGWKELPPDGMRKAVFQVPGTDGKMAQVMVIPLPGAPSDIQTESVNMWRTELRLPPLSRDEVAAQSTAIQLGDAKGELFEMANAAPSPSENSKIRTLGAIAQRENVMWFAKMTGADELVAEQKDEFVHFLKSLKFEDPEPARQETR